MSIVADRIAEIAAALKLAPELGGASPSTDPGQVPAVLPAVVIGPPQLLWETGLVEPTSMTLLLYLVVDASERALPTLWDLVPAVAAAVDETDGAITQAVPGSYVSGQMQLPCYEITIEVPL